MNANPIVAVSPPKKDAKLVFLESDLDDLCPMMSFEHYQLFVADETPSTQP